LKERLDKILVSKGLVKSREIAKALVIEGKVFVDGKKITKSGTSVSETSDIYLKEGELPYVSRGGLKLEAAINFFNIDVNNKIIMDVGSSTGGFTDCLLKKGAKKVYCIDVGYGQLAWSLRKDPRVVVMERTNIRYLTDIVKSQKSKVKSPELEDLIKSNIDMATADVSFISLTKVIPAVLEFLKEESEVLALVKPQFEVGKGEVGKGGIVREEEKRLRAVKGVQEDLEKLGLKTIGLFQSPITGQKGNIEIFLYMKRGFYGRR
jgi:23S rRNA (cytidine1920-2'-O)/16S rRNA (cytidine1409-2'-O)-methyltransferase